MWDKKNDAAPQPTRIAHGTGIPAPAASQPEQSPSAATIGKAVKIIGDIVSREDLYLDGEIEGSVCAKDSKLTIGVNGRAKSNIVAREVVIQGEVRGNCETSQKLTIRKEGSLIGNIKTMGIVIEDDAYFKGSIDIVRNAEVKKAAE